MAELKPMPYDALEQDAQAGWLYLVNGDEPISVHELDRFAKRKHLTDAECAAETWAAHSAWVEAHMAIECAADDDGWYQAHLPQRRHEVDTWYRFATLTHAHEEQA